MPPRRPEKIRLSIPPPNSRTTEAPTEAVDAPKTTLDKLAESAPFWLSNLDTLTGEEFRQLAQLLNQAPTKLKIHTTIGALQRAKREGKVREILDQVLNRLNNKEFIEGASVETILNVAVVLTKMQEADSAYIKDTIKSIDMNRFNAEAVKKVEENVQETLSLTDRFKRMTPAMRESIRKTISQIAILEEGANNPDVQVDQQEETKPAGTGS